MKLNERGKKYAHDIMEKAAEAGGFGGKAKNYSVKQTIARAWCAGYLTREKELIISSPKDAK